MDLAQNWPVSDNDRFPQMPQMDNPKALVSEPLIPSSVSHWLLQNVWVKWKANFLNYVF